MGFIEKGTEYGYDQVLSGTGHKVMELVVPTGKKVKRGDVVNAEAELTTDGTDAFGVVLETKDGTTTATKTTVVVSGEVIAEGIKVNGTVDGTVIVNLRNKGIIVKKLGGRY